MLRVQSLSNKQRFLLSWSSQPPEHPLQTIEEFPPAVLRTLISCLLIGTEAGLLHANMGAALCRSQRPEHHPLKPAFASPNTPVIRQAPQPLHDQHLAVDNTIPLRHRVGPELELMSGHRFEVVVHHPLREQL